MTVKSKARVLELPLRGVGQAARRGVASFLDEFADDLKYELVGDELVIYLYALDVQKFHARLKAQRQAHGGRLKSKALAPSATAALESLLEQIKSIRSYGIKGGKRIYAGYADERKVRGRPAKVTLRTPHFYARTEDSNANVEVPKEFVDRILCADSLEILKRFPENCVDLVFTSPPYNFGLEYSETNDAAFWQSYFDKLFAVLDECARVLKFGGRIVVNVQPLYSDYIPTHHLISQHLMQRGLIWKAEILWEKNNYNAKYTAWGSWKSPSNPYLKYTWEFLEVFCKGSLKKAGDSGRADITAEEFKKWVVGKWSIAPERGLARFNHPAVFPEELAYRVLKLFSFKGDVVLDPFNGVGTTTLVAKRTGRSYIGIDISPEYCKTALHRLGAIDN